MVDRVDFVERQQTPSKLAQVMRSWGCSAGHVVMEAAGRHIQGTLSLSSNQKSISIDGEAISTWAKRIYREIGLAGDPTLENITIYLDNGEPIRYKNLKTAHFLSKRQPKSPSKIFITPPVSPSSSGSASGGFTPGNDISIKLFQQEVKTEPQTASYEPSSSSSTTVATNEIPVAYDYFKVEENEQPISLARPFFFGAAPVQVASGTPAEVLFTGEHHTHSISTESTQDTTTCDDETDSEPADSAGEVKPDQAAVPSQDPEPSTPDNANDGNDNLVPATFTIDSQAPVPLREEQTVPVATLLEPEVENATKMHEELKGDDHSSSAASLVDRINPDVAMVPPLPPLPQPVVSVATDQSIDVVVKQDPCGAAAEEQGNDGKAHPTGPTAATDTISAGLFSSQMHAIESSFPSLKLSGNLADLSQELVESAAQLIADELQLPVVREGTLREYDPYQVQMVTIYEAPRLLALQCGMAGVGACTVRDHELTSRFSRVTTIAPNAIILDLAITVCPEQGFAYTDRQMNLFCALVLLQLGLYPNLQVVRLCGVATRKYLCPILCAAEDPGAGVLLYSILLNQRSFKVFTFHHPGAATKATITPEESRMLEQEDMRHRELFGTIPDLGGVASRQVARVDYLGQFFAFAKARQDGSVQFTVATDLKAAASPALTDAMRGSFDFFASNEDDALSSPERSESESRARRYAAPIQAIRPLDKSSKSSGCMIL